MSWLPVQGPHVEWASHTTGWLRMRPLRSVMSAQLTSSLSRRNTPRVPWYVPSASTTLSPSWNTGPINFALIMFVYLPPTGYGRNFGLFTSLVPTRVVVPAIQRNQTYLDPSIPLRDSLLSHESHQRRLLLSRLPAGQLRTRSGRTVDSE